MPQTTTEIITFAFYLLAGIQALYWLYFLVGLGRLKTLSAEESHEGISVVVAAQNEIHNLRALAPKVLRQNYDLFEVIIVNDRSDDGTIEFLIDLEQKHEKLRAIHVHDRPEHINGKKYALTLGIKAAKFDNILLTDADCLPASDNWLQTMARGYRQSEFVLGFSGYTRLRGFLNYFIRFETILTGIQYLASAANGQPYMGVGRNLGYKKSTFLSKKGFLGFQEVVGGDDDLFVNKYATAKNTTVVVEPEALVLSTPKLTWRAYLRQKHRHLSVGKHYRGTTKIILGLFNFSWLLYLLILTLVFLLSVKPVVIALIAGGRLAIILLTVFIGTKRFGYPFEWLGVAILDLVYPFYYIFVGLKAFFIKTVSWE